MQAITHIPFELKATDLLGKLHIASDSEDAAEFAALLDEARGLADPKALYREAFIEAKGEETI